MAQRSDAKKRLAQITKRATACARYQEGEEPAEDHAELYAEAQAIVDEIEDLVRSINRTNAATELAPGLTITDAIARREALAGKRKLAASMADAAVGHDTLGWGRRTRSELRFLSDVPVRERRREADELAKQYRELDVRLQAANWSTELIG